MSQNSTDNQGLDIEQRLAALLASNLSPEEFARQLFWINHDQVQPSDPDLAFILRACAIPAQFDTAIIGILRGDSSNEATDRRLLEVVTHYSFVQRRAEDVYSYHDNTRDVLLEDWQTEAH